MLNTMISSLVRFFRTNAFSCLACLMLFVPGRWALAIELPPDAVDWVCVTVPELVDDFEPLAAYRENQGLRTRIVTTTEIGLWAWDESGFPARLRASVRAMVEQWGVRYLLIGGDQQQVPAPFTHHEGAGMEWTGPVDMYYACLDGDWDGDGDGWVGEMDDAPDVMPELSVGRLPIEDAAGVAVAVAKILAYENRSAAQADRVLLASTVFDDTWQMGDDPIPMFGNAQVEDLMTVLASSDTPYQTTPLLQYIFDTPEALELTPDSLIEHLAFGDYDHVLFQSQASVNTWSCGEYRWFGIEDIGPLAEGRPFVLDAMTCASADVASEGLVEAMLAMPGGGAVAARGWSTLIYLTPMFAIDESYWIALAEGNHDRLGDVQNAAIANVVSEIGVPFILGHIPWMMILGDPALVVRSPSQTDVPMAVTGLVRNLKATPNPFNPSTMIRFDLDAGVEVRVVVEVFDLKGRLLAVEHDGPMSPGAQALPWTRLNGAEASGMYFVRVRAGASSATIPMVQLK